MNALRVIDAAKQLSRCFEHYLLSCFDSLKVFLGSRASFYFILFSLLRGQVPDQIRIHEYETKCNSSGD